MESGWIINSWLAIPFHSQNFILCDTLTVFITLNKHTIIYRNHCQLFVLSQVFRIYKIYHSNVLWKLFAEFVHWFVSLVPWWFDFYRADFKSTGEQKIYFIIVLATDCGPSVIEELFSTSAQHLSHNIFINIAKVSGEFVAKQFLIDNVLSNGFVLRLHSDAIWLRLNVGLHFIILKSALLFRFGWTHKKRVG